jgi:hypothetical protein
MTRPKAFRRKISASSKLVREFDSSISGIYARRRIYRFGAGLPDGIFFTKIFKYFGVLRMENVGIFYVHMVQLMDVWCIFIAIWYTLRPFGIFLPVFGMLLQEKSGNPGLGK